MTTRSYTLSVRTISFISPALSGTMHIFSKKPHEPADDTVAAAPSDTHTHFFETEDVDFPGGPSPDAPSSSRFQQPAEGAIADPEPNVAATGADVDRQPSVAIATGISSKENQTASPTQQSSVPQDDDAPQTATDRTDTASINTNGMLPDGRSASPTHPSPSHEMAYAPLDAPDAASTSTPVRRSTSTKEQDPKPILRNASQRSHRQGAPVAAAAVNGQSAGSPAPASVSSRRTDGTGVGVGGTGSAFTDGAAMSSAAAVDPGVHERVASAEDELSAKDKAKINKQEYKDGKRLSTIIRGEANTEKAALEVATKELGELQKLQKAAVKEESKSHTIHSKAITDAHKAEMDFLAAQSAQERAQTALRAAAEALERSREHARDTTEMLREKMDEVERIRMHKQADDRERALKVKGLTGESKSGFSRLFGSS
ncbi:hypothetical protein DENSPDRAFT_832723 [Dentipellis sp. KUC8613]|nr:hypothetical protein DENSPDRAFT_832723 [Dentipellis sp. KUC8613]